MRGLHSRFLAICEKFKPKLCFQKRIENRKVLYELRCGPNQMDVLWYPEQPFHTAYIETVGAFGLVSTWKMTSLISAFNVLLSQPISPHWKYGPLVINNGPRPYEIVLWRDGDVVNDPIGNLLATDAWHDESLHGILCDYIGDKIELSKSLSPSLSRVRS